MTVWQALSHTLTFMTDAQEGGVGKVPEAPAWSCRHSVGLLPGHC